ncbi:hypothetical protein D3C80_1285110 [compost metagenome]
MPHRPQRTGSRVRTALAQPLDRATKCLLVIVHAVEQHEADKTTKGLADTRDKAQVRVKVHTDGKIAQRARVVLQGTTTQGTTPCQQGGALPRPERTQRPPLEHLLPGSDRLHLAGMRQFELVLDSQPAQRIALLLSPSFTQHATSQSVDCRVTAAPTGQQVDGMRLNRFKTAGESTQRMLQPIVLRGFSPMHGTFAQARRQGLWHLGQG